MTRVVLIVYYLVMSLSSLLASKKIVCYYKTIARNGPKENSFPPTKIDPYLCTHLIIFTAGISGGFLKASDKSHVSSLFFRGLYERCTDLKKVNPKLKVSLSLDGIYTMDLNDKEVRRSLVDSTTQILVDYNFDGLDLKYPNASFDNRYTLKFSTTQLIQEFRTKFNRNGLLLSSAVANDIQNIDESYQIDQLSINLDFVTVMAFDFLQSNNVQRHNSPLYPKADDSVIESRLNIDFTVNYWLYKGLAKEKLILGLGLYAQSFNVAKSTSNLVIELIGLKSKSKIVERREKLTYDEARSLIAKNSMESVYDKQLAVSYAFNETKWIGFESLQTLKQKAFYVLDNQLNGIAFWDLQSDDYNGKLNESLKFPLIKEVRNVFLNTKRDLPHKLYTIKHIKTKAALAPKISHQSTTTYEATLDPCYKGDGFYPDYASKCTQYYVCSNSNTVKTINYFKCPGSLAFDLQINACNFKYLIKCSSALF